MSLVLTKLIRIDIPVLMEKYNSIKTIVTLLIENFKSSGQNVDPTEQWGDLEIEDFLKGLQW